MQLRDERMLNEEVKVALGLWLLAREGRHKLIFQRRLVLVGEAVLNRRMIRNALFKKLFR